MIYGSNKIQEREHLWQTLRDYSSLVDGPWVVCGDFNSITETTDKIGGADMTWAEMAPMRNMIADCHLQEMKTSGSYYTWNNKHEDETKVYSGIDRKKVAFKYFNMWALSDDFDVTVNNSWKEEIRGIPMFRVVKKLKRLKTEFHKLNTDHFSDIENLTHVTVLAFKHFQQQLIQEPLNDIVCRAERECAKDLSNLNKAINSYLAKQNKCGSEMGMIIPLSSILVLTEGE
ncbi:uncharacterized protein LOC141590446 [Silene latifolia]|uniref:uncharacterized protein LOC141590446 n=1 Tax=Silene latifolia TaxID=37657 RepID=UPI003D781EA7